MYNPALEGMCRRQFMLENGVTVWRRCGYEQASGGCTWSLIEADVRGRFVKRTGARVQETILDL